MKFLYNVYSFQNGAIVYKMREYVSLELAREIKQKYEKEFEWVKFKAVIKRVNCHFMDLGHGYKTLVSATEDITIEA